MGSSKVDAAIPKTFLASSYTITSPLLGVTTAIDIATGILESSWFDSRVYLGAYNPWGIHAASGKKSKAFQDGGVFVAEDGKRYGKYSTLTQAFKHRRFILEWYGRRAKALADKLRAGVKVGDVATWGTTEFSGYSRTDKSWDRSRKDLYRYLEEGIEGNILGQLDLWWAPLQDYRKKVERLIVRYDLNRYNDKGDTYVPRPDIVVGDEEEPFAPGPDHGEPTRRTGYGDRGPSMWSIIVPLLLGLAGVAKSGLFGSVLTLITGGSTGGLAGAFAKLLGRFFQRETEVALEVEKESLDGDEPTTGPDKLRRALELLGVDGNKWWVNVAVAVINYLKGRDWSKIIEAAK